MKTEKIRIGIVDKHPVFRNALKKVIDKKDTLDIVLESDSRLDFNSKYEGNINILMIDIEMLLQDQYNLVSQTKLNNPDLKIIALSFITDELYFTKLLNNGVNAIISKHTNRNEVYKAIESVIQGETYFSENYNINLINNNIKISKMETKKVLLVDDDMDIITVAKAVLKKEGFEVYSASNKTEGLKLANEIMPDIAILDVMMTTHYEGFEIAKGFKENPNLKHIPVLMQSSIDVLISTDDSVYDMAKDMRNKAQYKELDVLLIKDLSTGHGCVDYKTADNKSHLIKVEGFIKKPIESEYLINTVNKLLNI